jgi:pre-mRNA-splicing factor CWC22
MDSIKMNEDDTTSSSRIFVKIMFQEIIEGMGLVKLKERFKEDQLQPFLGNIFPVDNPKNTRFSINFFTSIGLGAVTENMREQLKRAPALMVRFLFLVLLTSDFLTDSRSSALSDGTASSARSCRSFVRFRFFFFPLFFLPLRIFFRLLFGRFPSTSSTIFPPFSFLLSQPFPSRCQVSSSIVLPLP